MFVHSHFCCNRERCLVLEVHLNLLVETKTHWGMVVTGTNRMEKKERRSLKVIGSSQISSYLVELLQWLFCWWGQMFSSKSAPMKRKRTAKLDNDRLQPTPVRQTLEGHGNFTTQKENRLLKKTSKASTTWSTLDSHIAQTSVQSP